MDQIQFTVFTSTYNRAHTIHRVWESLNSQTLKSFEWIVIDNKSDDNIREVLDAYQKEASFPMHVIYNDDNLGKHMAINIAVKRAKGELFIIADSDDIVLPQALQRFKEIWDSIDESEKEKYSGVNVQCLNKETNEFVGDPYPEDRMTTNNLELKYKFRIKGEKWGMIRTDMLKKYPYPDKKNELGYFIDNIVWFKFAHEGYKTLCINEALKYYFVDTNNSVTKIKTKNPIRGADVYYTFNNWNLNTNMDFLLKYAPKKMLFKDFINVIRFGLADDKNFIQILKSAPNPKTRFILTLIGPLGYFAYLTTFRKYKKKQAA